MANIGLEFEKELKFVLRKILQFEKINIDKCLLKFLKHLRWELNEDYNVSVAIFSEWIQKVVAVWSLEKKTSTPEIISFILNLSGILLENENRFNKLNCNNFVIKLINITKARQLENPNLIKISYSNFLSSFLEHKSGIEFMIACSYWEDIFNLSLKDPSPEVVDSSVNFLVKLLEKSIDYDEDFCETLVKKIMLPLSENIYKSIKSSSDISDEIALEHLKPILKFVTNILEKLLRSVCFENRDFGVCLIFLKNFHVEERICDFIIIAQKKSLLFDLSKIMFMMQFLELYGKIITKMTTLEKVTTTINRIKDNFLTNLFLGNFDEHQDFCNFGIFFWKLVNTKINLAKFCKVSSDVLNFSDELLIITCMPCLCILLKYLYDLKEFEKKTETDMFREAFSDNMMKLFSISFMRVCFFWRPKFLDSTNTFELAVQSLQMVTKSIKNISRNSAVLVFKMFVYTIKDITENLKKHPERIFIFTEEVTYFVLVFELLGIVIEENQIVLRDGIEATYVMSLCFDFLCLWDWETPIIISVLKLINIALVHYMAPNMALLVENSTDSTLVMLGPAIYSKLLEKDSEIKKHALDVVHTIADISSKKFPSLQKVLMDSELPSLVVKMSVCDTESFVRATAIKCLQEMIQVEEIWNNSLKSENLTQKMQDILINETEGIVRVEAATFMCVAYEQQQFPKDKLETIYETMIYSSTTDLHWEVKVRALEFWDKVIKTHLQNQGMIDGSFPNVTFSKEHRKIVTLTDSEIRKRLFKVLNQLSEIGCLGVLTSAIKDDCDMEVAKTAVKITQRLVDLFRKYNVRCDFSAPTSPVLTEYGVSSTVSLSSGVSVDESMDSPASSHEFNDEIIDQIVNTKDVNLLRGVYSPSDYGSVNNYEFQVRKIVSPNEFLQFTQQDLNNVISEKKKWLNGIEDLGSLLDDMLKTYDDDVNNMDCY